MEIELREMVSFKLGEEIGRDVFFVLSRAWDKTKKNIFLYFFTELKTYNLSYFYLHKSCLNLAIILRTRNVSLFTLFYYNHFFFQIRTFL